MAMMGQAPAPAPGQATPEQMLMAILQQHLNPDPNRQLGKAIGQALMQGGSALASHRGNFLSALGPAMAAGAQGFSNTQQQQENQQLKAATDLFSISEARRKAQLDELFKNAQMENFRADNARADAQAASLDQWRTDMLAQKQQGLDALTAYRQGQQDLQQQRVDNENRRIDQSERRLASDLEYKNAQISKIKQEAQNWEPQFRRQNLELRAREYLNNFAKRIGMGTDEEFKTPEQKQSELEAYRAEAKSVMEALGLDSPQESGARREQPQAPLQGDSSVFKKGAAQQPQAQGIDPSKAERTITKNGKTYYKIGGQWYEATGQ